MADSIVEIATIQKNSKEEIRIELHTYGGHRLFSAWVWYRGANGEMRPSKSGLSFQASKLDQFYASVEEAVLTAQEEGSLP